MRKLSDNKFDELLRQKAESADFDFDESSWEKMENKLRRRDRVIFVRNSSLILMLLLLAGSSYFMLNDSSQNDAVKLAKKPAAQRSDSMARPEPVLQKGSQESSLQAESGKVVDSKETDFIEEEATFVKSREPITSKRNENIFALKDATADKPIRTETEDQNISPSLAGMQPIAAENSASNQVALQITQTDSLGGQHDVPTDSSTATRLSRTKKKPFTFSITALAGPEFSAIESIAGKKADMNVGILLNATYRNRLTLSSGLRYGIKSYQAEGYDYGTPSPSRAAQIAGIDASCNILEIPVQASYSVYKKGNKSIALSSGISSYLMLKEEYNFRYTPRSGRKDYSLIKNNANQHYFSVVNLSARYQIKPKSSNILWAIEPYVKLPLGGVGEGDIKLKSSGISLNLTYDLKKKNY